MLTINRSNVNAVANGQEAPRSEPLLPVKEVKNSASLMRFREAAGFIARMMPRERGGEAGVDQKYWLEIRDPKHRDRISLNGLDSQSGAFGAWLEADNSRLGLFEWIDQNPDVEVRTLKDGPKHRLSESIGYINYLQPSQAAKYRVDVSCGQWTTAGALLDTTQLPGKRGMEGHAAFVIHTDGEIFVHPYEKGKWQHTSTTGGRPVLSAGMLAIEQGKAKSFHLDSGHYTPGLPQLKNFLEKMVEKGVNVAELDIHAKGVSADKIRALIDSCNG